MAAFRHLLSPNVKFLWTEELSQEFTLLKENIIQKIHERVTMFQVLRTTALVLDWSETGQSLGLWQNHCECAGPVTGDGKMYERARNACVNLFFFFSIVWKKLVTNYLLFFPKSGWRNVFMFFRFNNDAQSRYSAIEKL